MTDEQKAEAAMLRKRHDDEVARRKAWDAMQAKQAVPQVDPLERNRQQDERVRQHQKRAGGPGR